VLDGRRFCSCHTTAVNARERTLSGVMEIVEQPRQNIIGPAISGTPCEPIRSLARDACRGPVHAPLNRYALACHPKQILDGYQVRDGRGDQTTGWSEWNLARMIQDYCRYRRKGCPSMVYRPSLQMLALRPALPGTSSFSGGSAITTRVAPTPEPYADSWVGVRHEKLGSSACRHAT